MFINAQNLDMFPQQIFIFPKNLVHLHKTD